MITSSTQVRYFIRDDGTSVGNLARFETLLNNNNLDHEDAEYIYDAADLVNPEEGDEVAVTVYCTSVADIELLVKLIKEFEET